MGLQVVEVFPAARRSLCGQLSRPSQRRNYLLAFSGFRWLSRFSGCLGRGESPRPPPAALPAFTLLRSAGSPIATLRAQSHHRAGLGEPWSSGRVQLAQSDPAADLLPGWLCRERRPTGGQGAGDDGKLTQLRVKAPS